MGNRGFGRRPFLEKREKKENRGRGESLTTRRREKKEERRGSRTRWRNKLEKYGKDARATRGGGRRNKRSNSKKKNRQAFCAKLG